jgi:hypothetical protein
MGAAPLRRFRVRSAGTVTGVGALAGIGAAGWLGGEAGWLDPESGFGLGAA